MSITPKGPRPIPHTQWDGSIKKAAQIIETVIDQGGKEADADIRVLHNRTVIRVIDRGTYDDIEVGDWLVRTGDYWHVMTDERVRQMEAAERQMA
jgi:hypothetical protein